MGGCLLCIGKQLIKPGPKPAPRPGSPKPCKPNCTAEVALKVFACGAPHRCTQNDSCEALLAKLAAGGACLAAKMNVDRCYGSIDYTGKDHPGSQQETKNAIANCINVMVRKCRK